MPLDPIALGMQPHPEGGQYLVRPAEWQSAQPAGDEPALVACVVAPGFDYADFTLHTE